METPFIEHVDRQIAAALQGGALQPIRAEEDRVVDAGLPFALRWVSTLAVKDAAKVTMPGGPRDPSFNPFANPAPLLTVGPVAETHLAILNKFPVCERHLVLARCEFEEQLLPLALCDFNALAVVMGEAGGLGFYNGGTAAGASQRHKHVQWIPDAPGNASLRLYALGLPAGSAPGYLSSHAALRMRHCFVRIGVHAGCSVEEAAQRMHGAFLRACGALGLEPGEDGLLPPFNLLVDADWMLVVPRSAECFEGISIAAINFGGVVYVRQREQMDVVRRAGPLAMLAAVGC